MAFHPLVQLHPRNRARQRHDAVSHRSKAILSIGKQGWVQPGIQPISISANLGLRTRFDGWCEVGTDGCPSGAVAPGWWVDATFAKPSPYPGFVRPGSCDLGVGHGNCEAEPSLATVRGARFFRAEYVPFTIEPEDDQRTKHPVEEGSPISGKDAWDVLKKDVSRLHFTDDPGNVVPDESLVVHSSPLAGEADGLAWESRSDEIHRSTPRPAVEGANVVPDRSVIQAAVLDSRRDDSCGELAPFDVADGADIGGKAQSEVESAHAGAQADGT
jgi:hypothetical protein